MISKIILLCACTLSNIVYANVHIKYGIYTAVTKPITHKILMIAHQFNTTQLIDSIAVTVNDDVITHQEINNRLKIEKKYLATKNIHLISSVKLQRQLLEKMIIERIQIKLAQKHNILIDENIINHAIMRIAEQNQLTISEFFTALKRTGISFSSFKKDIYQRIILQRLREQEVDNKITVSESEINHYLIIEKNNANEYENINLAQILIRVPENATLNQLAARRQHAEKILQQLKSGADFAKIAIIYSNSQEALNGGNLGYRHKKNLPKLFLNAINNLKLGEISNIIKSDNGFHILKLIDRRGSNVNKKNISQIIKQTHVRHILIKINDITSAEAAHHRIQKIKESLDKNTATFEELAILYSDDLSAPQGGDLGWIYPNDTVPEFERVMNKLQLKEISQPVESSFGVHLIQVLERKNDIISEKRMREAIYQIIRDRKIEEMTEEWQQQLRSQAYVEYHINDIL